MTTDSILKPNPTSSKIFNNNAGPNLSKIRHMKENFNVLEFYELAANEWKRDNYEGIDKISYTVCIAEI